MRRYLTHALVAVAMTTPVTAFAQDAKCPPGAWFCEEVEPPRAAPPAEAPPAVEVPDAAEAEALPPPPAPPRPPGPPGPPRGSRRVVVYQTSPTSPPTQIVIITPAGAPPPGVVVRQVVPPPPPPPPKRRWRPEWGLNLRVEGVSMGHRGDVDEDAGMGGVGLGLRYRPRPWFAIEGGVDTLTGTDYNGFQRTELVFSLNNMVYLNPKNRAQIYLMGGVHYSRADVEQTERLSSSNDDFEFSSNQEYDYLGAQGGIGLEIRLSRRIALNLDMLGFIRGRLDQGKGAAPEFTDPDTGRTTNTSGGGLFRGGLNIYW